MLRHPARHHFVLGRVPTGTRVLCIGAHPDDFEGGCPNTVMRLVQAGAKVTMALSTGGEYGLTRKFVRFYGKRLQAIRRREMERVIRGYGVNSDGTPKVALWWLGFIDGYVVANDALMGKIRALIQEVRPAILITPDPYLPVDWHNDHRRTGYACLKVLRDMPPADRPKVVLGMFSHQCDCYVPYTPAADAFDLFRLHHSQAGGHVHGWPVEMAAKLLHLFMGACALNNLRKCGYWGEGFRILPPPYEAPPAPAQLWRRMKRHLTLKNYGPVKPSRYFPIPEELGLNRGATPNGRETDSTLL